MSTWREGQEFENEIVAAPPGPQLPAGEEFGDEFFPEPIEWPNEPEPKPNPVEEPKFASFHPIIQIVTPAGPPPKLPPRLKIAGSGFFKVKWEIPQKFHASSGWIIQRVDVDFNVKTCNGKQVNIKNYFQNRIDPEALYPLWEAWEFIKGGDVWAGKKNVNGNNHLKFDTFQLPLFYSGGRTKGTASMTGEVKGIPGIKLPQNLKPTNLPPTGSLPTSKNKPKIWDQTAKGAPHLLTVKEWNSCKGQLKVPTYHSIPK